MSILTKNVLMGRDLVAGTLSGELLVNAQGAHFGSRSLDLALTAVIDKVIADDASNAATDLAGRNALVAAANAESSARQSAEAAIQADVDQNESDSDASHVAATAARAANESARDASIAASKVTADAAIVTAKGLADTAIANELAARLSAEGAIDARVDAILSGSSESLDQFVEVVAAFEAADGTLSGSIGALTTAASTDRALIRTEIAAAKVVDDAALATELVARADGDAAERSFALAARNVIIAQHGADDGAAATARGVIQADVDANEAAALSARNTMQADVDQNEADADASFATALAARAAMNTAAAAESTARQAAEAAIATDLGEYETSNDAALAAVVATHGADDSANVAARLVLTNGLAAEIVRAGAKEDLIDARVDAILSGSSSALDQFVEVVAAFEAADGTLSGSIGALTTAASADRALIRSEIAAAKLVDDAALAAELAARIADVNAEETRALAAEAAVRSEFAAADTSAATFNLSARNVIIAQHGTDDAAALAARGVIQADVNANELEEKARMDEAGGFHAESTATSWAMGWGAGKPRVSFAIAAGGAITMSVDVE